MHSGPYNEKRVLDRTEEVGVFEKLLNQTSGGRLLAFHAIEGAGKTDLLQRLRFEATKRITVDGVAPPIVSVSLDKDQTDHQVVDRIADGMKAAGLATDHYDEVSGRYTNKAGLGLSIDASTHTEGSDIGTLTGGTVSNNTITPFDPAVQVQLRREMTGSLIEDIKQAGQTRVVVLMIDQLEKATPDTAEWLRRLLRTVVFGEHSDTSGTTVVLAGKRDEGELLAYELEAMAGTCRGGPRCQVRLELSQFTRDHIEQLAALRWATTLSEDKLNLLERYVRDFNLTVGAIIAAIGSDLAADR